MGGEGCSITLRYGQQEVFKPFSRPRICVDLPHCSDGNTCRLRRIRVHGWLDVSNCRRCNQPSSSTTSSVTSWQHGHDHAVTIIIIIIIILVILLLLLLLLLIITALHRKIIHRYTNVSRHDEIWQTYRYSWHRFPMVQAVVIPPPPPSCRRPRFNLRHGAILPRVQTWKSCHHPCFVPGVVP